MPDNPDRYKLLLKRWLLPLLILMALVTLLENRAMAAEPPRTLERGNGPEPDSLDPHRAQGLSAQQVIRDLFEGLVRDDADGRLVPAAAERFEISDDGLVYRFHLRAEARFADGSALTAPDFVYSFERALDPLTTAPYAAMLSPIAGATERLAGKREPALGVRAVDPLILEIRLAAPRSDFLRRLAMPVAMPVQRTAIEQHATGFTRAGRLHGNGAYRLVEWTPQSTLVLERNPYYRNAASISIERVRYHVTEDASQELKRYAAGELHLTETLPPGQAERLRAEYSDELVIAPAFASFFLGFNLRQLALRDRELREALSLAIDREILVRYITGNGEAAAYEIVPKVGAGKAFDRRSNPQEPPEAVPKVGAGKAFDRRSNPQEPPEAVPKVGAGKAFDRRSNPQKRGGARLQWADWTQEQRNARARELYVAAGFTADQPLQIELRYNTSLVNRRLTLAIASMWKEVLGVDTRLRNEDWKVFVQNRRAGVVTQVFRAGWFADYADPLNFLEPFVSGHALNAIGFADASFDGALGVAGSALGPERADALRVAEQTLLDAHALIPLYHYATKHLVSPSVCGYRAHPLDHHPSEFLRFCEPAIQ